MSDKIAIGIAEAAERLSVGLTTMRQLISAGDVESVKVGALTLAQGCPLHDQAGWWAGHLR